MTTAIKLEISERRKKFEAYLLTNPDVPLAQAAREHGYDEAQARRIRKQMYERRGLTVPVALSKSGRPRKYPRRAPEIENTVPSPSGRESPLVGSTIGLRTGIGSSPNPDAAKAAGVPIELAFMVPESATLVEKQRAYVLRAKFLGMPNRTAFAGAGITQAQGEAMAASKEIDEKTGLTFSAQMAMAFAVGTTDHVAGLRFYADAHPESQAAAAVREWLLERTDQAFIRRTAQAVAIQSEVFIRDETNSDPRLLGTSVEYIDRQFAARVLEAHKDDEVIDVESREVEDDDES